MGYTNYLTLKREIPQETWEKIVEDCKKLYKNLPEYSESAGGCYSDVPLYLNGCFAYKLPQFNSKMIHFNGGSCPAKDRIKGADGWDDPKKGEDDWGHETFDLRPVPVKKQWDSGRDGFLFCKTARKPYDLMVKAVLLICKQYLKEDIEISSDGDDEPNNWKPALEFVSNVLEGEYTVMHFEMAL